VTVLAEFFVFDKNFVDAVDRLVMQPESKVDADAVQGAVDAWLLRAPERSDGVGRQLASWFSGAVQTTSPPFAAEAVKALAAVGRVYEANLDEALGSLQNPAAWAYERLVADPNPIDAVKKSGKVGKERFASMVGSGGSPALNELADGFDFDGRYSYFCMPLRAAFLRAVLSGFSGGSKVFERLVGAAKAASSQVLATNRSVPGRLFLALVLTEALDDLTYASFGTKGGGTETDWEKPADTRTAAGEQLWKLICDALRPDDATGDAEVEQTIKTIARWHKGEEQVVYAAHGETNRAERPKPYPFDVIIVPGYTSLGSTKDATRVSEQGVVRLRQAMRDYWSGLAPFILVSGGAVYPLGTEMSEAQLMYEWLVDPSKRTGDDQGDKPIPRGRVIREARARHSTTNLRNAARYMMKHGFGGPYLVTTGGDHALPTEAACALIAGGAVLAVGSVAGVVAAQEAFKGKDQETERKLATGFAAAGIALGAGAVVAGAVTHAVDNQEFYFQNPGAPIWGYNAHCMDALGYLPHYFLGDPREYIRYASADEEDGEKLPEGMFASIKERYEANEARYETVDTDMHAVMIPSPRSTLRENLRDPLDP
jgi:hypothetical protein